MRPGWITSGITSWIMGVALAVAIGSVRAQGVDSDAAELDRVVAEACRHSVVLLGEDIGHGAGRALHLKQRLVERLVDECGYSALLFESQVYDFLPLDHAYRSRRATPQQLAAAVGAPWSNAAGFDRLLAFLHRRATDGKLRLFGLSPTLGDAGALYARRQLATDVGRLIRPPYREGCIETLARYANGLREAAPASGPDARMQLASCANAMRSGIEHAGTSPLADAEAVLIAENLSRMASMVGVDEVEVDNLRDLAMADNLRWFMSRLPRDSKAIVWTTTMSAVRQVPASAPSRVPMGASLQRTFGPRMLAIGFSALSGSVAGAGGEAIALPALPQDALESRALADSAASLRYLDRAQLAQFGTISARPLDLMRPQPAHWSTLLDGLIVMRDEQPMERARPGRSRETR